MNGVLQQPHDSTSPSTGFGIDTDSVLIFSTAPAFTDVVFGSIYSTNLSSFEISDNAIDNFTGNGSTTDFTLSKTPPDNRNILVTLDGVVQYPTDTSTTRSYDLAENVLSFTNAPPNGVLIQVRHIGFAGGGGGSGGNLVSSVFGRTGDIVLTNADDITVRNIVAAAATFSGSVTIGGTLTYEDVKNVDSIGVITARSGIQGIGIQSGGINITTGILTAINFTGIGNTVTYDASTKIVSVSVGGVGAGGTFASNTVGVHTTKILGINTTTIAGSATSEGAVQVRGNIAIEEGLLTLDSNINTSVSVPSGKNALLIGPTTVGTGATIDIATGSTLVVV